MTSPVEISSAHGWRRGQKQHSQVLSLAFAVNGERRPIERKFLSVKKANPTTHCIVLFPSTLHSQPIILL